MLGWTSKFKPTKVTSSSYFIWKINQNKENIRMGKKRLNSQRKILVPLSRQWPPTMIPAAAEEISKSLEFVKSEDLRVSMDIVK